jgi:hypothetical protein
MWFSRLKKLYCIIRLGDKWSAIRAWKSLCAQQVGNCMILSRFFLFFWPSKLTLLPIVIQQNCSRNVALLNWSFWTRVAQPLNAFRSARRRQHRSLSKSWRSVASCNVRKKNKHRSLPFFLFYRGFIHSLWSHRCKSIRSSNSWCRTKIILIIKELRTTCD